MPEREHSGLTDRLRGELQHLQEESQFRTLENPSGVSLCSNDYLGLADDPRLKSAVMDAAGGARAMGSTGSRLLSGNTPEWEELESEFARFVGAEAALYFGSGYAANLGLLGAILRPGDIVFSDALNHASLIDGIRLSRAQKIIYPHLDLVCLEKRLREHQESRGAKVIVTETVFSMEGDVAPLPGILELARKYGADVALDEAHAIGICGPHGRGMAAEYRCERAIFASVHTCGKALASAGAFVCGGDVLRQFLVNRARTFIFSTAMPPYMAAQIHAALHLAREADEARAHLADMAALLRRELSLRGLPSGTSATHIVPVILGTNEKALHVAGQLQAAGFAAKAIRPPTVPAGTSRIRLSLTCKITAEDVRRIVDVIFAACERLPHAEISRTVHV